MRLHHRRPFSLRVRWVMCRSITTKPVACSARWFVGSIGRWGEEAEVRFPVLARPFGQVPGVLGVRHAGGGCLPHLFPVHLQRLLKVPRRHLATPDCLEQCVRQYLLEVFSRRSASHRATLDCLEQCVLQRRHPLRQMLPVQTRGCFPHLPRAGRYPFPAAGSISIGCPLKARILAKSWGAIDKENPAVHY